MRRTLLAFGVLGLWVCTACSPGSPQDGTGNRVVIRMEHSAFEPKHLEFERGTTVTFVVRNTDPIDHEFILGNESVQQIHEKGTEAHHGSKPGEISVPANAERTTTYTFEEDGTLIYGCHLPGHYDFGMKGTVTVE